MTSLWPLMEGKLDFLLRPSIYIGSSIIMYAFLPDSCCAAFCKKWEEDNFDNSDSKYCKRFGHRISLLLIYDHFIGTLNENLAPMPSLLFSAHILPPWASMILLEINNPMPVSSYDFETNIENNLGNISGSIPVPVSFTVTITYAKSSLIV